ncbi:MAG: deoxyribodipyrimidine photo-lyase, partial [Halomonas sp.]|nr:deoxyribodipyrimidine photo-lyase [Halomonas sp.]
MTCQLVWFRSDLRTHDHSALAAAARRGPVIAVFVHCVPQWQRHGHGANKIYFWRRGVAALGTALDELNIPLLQREASSFAEIPALLLAVAREHEAQALHFNREYLLDEWRRDQATREAFANAGLAVHAHTDAVAFAPGELLTGKGGYYSVFTPFAKAWHREVSASRLALRDTPRPQPRLAVSGDPLPPEPPWRTPPVTTDTWPAGQEFAADRLQRFLRHRVRQYHRQRDFPALAGTSELSPYLALGMLSHRQCLQAVMSLNGGQLADGDAGLTAWVNELVWREFYQHIAFGHPDICRHRPFRAHTTSLTWRDDEPGFKAWCEGRTGYPLVDAGMRQLVRTG